MKKHNTLKKFYALMLTVSLLISSMIIPAHAIVPGEDAFVGTQEDGYIQVDFENQTTEFIPKSEIPHFTGDSTYDALNPKERERLEAINAEVLADSNKEIFSPTALIDGEYYFVSPSYQLYSGVVLIATWRNGIRQGHGTGFLVDDDTIMTALHVIYGGYDKDKKELDMSQGFPDEVRVYYDVSIDIMNGTEDEIEAAIEEFFNTNTNYVTVTQSVFSSAVLPTDNGNDYEYDWILGKLSSPLTGRYYWNCTVPTSTLEDKTSYIVGYPGTHKFQMVETVGTFAGVGDQVNIVLSTNSNESGISGAPVYGDWGGIKCYAVHIMGEPVYSTGVKIYPDLFDVIVDYINE